LLIEKYHTKICVSTFFDSQRPDYFNTLPSADVQR
jgi:hypothetical protein